MMFNACNSRNHDSNTSRRNHKIQHRQPDTRSCKKSRAGLVTILLTCCLLLGLAFTGCSASASPVGAWHNEELGQLLRFHDDGTVVIRTPYGDSEASYVYDKDGQQGVITYSGQAIGFTLDGDDMQVTWGEVQTAFVRGDMEIVAAVAEITVSDAEAPVSTPSPDAAPATPTPAPTDTPAPTATPDASAESSSPSWTLGPLASFSFVPLATPTPTPVLSLSPITSAHIVVPGNIFGTLTNPLAGNWYYTEDNSYILTFDGEGSFTVMQGSDGLSGTYTYDSATGTGELTIHLGYTSAEIAFTVDDDVLVWNDGTTFVRE